MSFFWRGRLREPNVRKPTPVRPVVRVRPSVYAALRAFAVARDVSMQAALENAVAGIPQRPASSRGPVHR